MAEFVDYSRSISISGVDTDDSSYSVSVSNISTTATVDGLYTFADACGQCLENGYMTIKLYDTDLIAG